MTKRDWAGEQARAQFYLNICREILAGPKQASLGFNRRYPPSKLSTPIRLRPGKGKVEE